MGPYFSRWGRIRAMTRTVPSNAGLLYWLDLAGVAVFAISGALAAMASELDLLGIVVIAAVTAVGGGTVRDVLLNRYPVFWIQDPAPLVVILASALLAIVWPRLLPVPTHALLVADALGLALFAMSGAVIARTAGCSVLVTLFMGTLTGVGGGVIRDVLTAKVPLVLRQDIYAAAAIAGIGLYLVLRRMGMGERSAFVAGLVGVATLRLAAVVGGWQLPTFRLTS